MTASTDPITRHGGREAPARPIVAGVGGPAAFTRAAAGRTRTGEAPSSVAGKADRPVAVVPEERHEGTVR